MRDFKVRKIDNGFIVTCGCMNIAFLSREALIRELDRYIQSPLDVEKEYTAKYRPNTLTPPVPCNTPDSANDICEEAQRR